MRTIYLIAILTVISISSIAQGNIDKKLHSGVDGWGLKVLQETGNETILLIGNSICNGYKSYVNENLSGFRVIAWQTPTTFCLNISMPILKKYWKMKISSSYILTSAYMAGLKEEYLWDL